MSAVLAPGAIVLGPFYSDGHEGASIIAVRGGDLWTRTPADYVPVRVIAGDRASGGYRPESLRVTGFAAA